jgi:NADPH:quinone reductase-like Zn-dependent oxidoreductase
VLSEEAVVDVPSHLSFEEAATLPSAAVTAWVALTGHRRVTAGDTALTQGSGGVSVAVGDDARPVIAGTGRGTTVRAIIVGSRVDSEAMNRALALRRLRPVINQTLAFAEVKAAYQHFEGCGPFGKVVVTDR